MIREVGRGNYQLAETKTDTKILKLDGKTYAWIKIDEIGEILVWSEKDHVIDAVLSSGEYRMYQVKHEPELTDLLHLELEAGAGSWQSYLLLTGLPTKGKKRARIVPTKDLITRN